MSTRELVVLGTASQVPTRHRNQNGYLLRWDGEGILFDPGEGTQRQMLRAGVAATDITRICITHFHGDHSLGLPGVIQRLSLDKVQHPVHAHFPASGAHYFERMRHATVVLRAGRPAGTPDRRGRPDRDREVRPSRPGGSSHPVEAFGYRLTEPDGRTMLPGKLQEHGIAGPDVGTAPAGGAPGDREARRRQRASARASGSRSSWTPASATRCTRSAKTPTCS